MDDRHDMQEKRFSFITTKYEVINIKIRNKKDCNKKKSKNCLHVISNTCTLFCGAYAQMNMLIHDFSRFNLGVCNCACYSVSLLFVGSAKWMPARNVALPIEIGHCKYILSL